MTNAHIDLSRLGEILRRQYAGTQPALKVRVSDDGRLLTVLPAKREAASLSSRLLKRAKYAPPRGKAFELYVSVEGASSTTPPQRIVPPTQTSSAIVLEHGARERTWTLPGPGEDHIVVRLRLGDGMSTEQAQQLLETVRRTVMP